MLIYVKTIYNNGHWTEKIKQTEKIFKPIKVYIVEYYLDKQIITRFESLLELSKFNCGRILVIEAGGYIERADFGDITV